MAKSLDREISSNPYYRRGIYGIFSKILFKPGFALQSTELIEMQDILQSQIGRFGNHVFRDGSIVKGRGLKEADPIITGERHTCYLYQLEPTANIHLKIPSGQNITIKRAGADDKTISGFIKIQIPSDDFKDPVTKDKYPPLLVARESEGVFVNDQAFYGDTLIGRISSATVLRGRHAEFADSFNIFYAAPHFIEIQPEAYVFAIGEIESFNTEVGIEVAERIITTDHIDYGHQLFDPASNSLNANAPGADRLQLELQLKHHSPNYSENSEDWKFYTLLRYENGNASYRAEFPIYNELGETLARRTFDINGNFVTDEFELTVNEPSLIPGVHKIDGIVPDSNGANVITITTQTPDATNYSLLEEAGNLDEHYLLFGTEENKYNRMLRVHEYTSNSQIKVSDVHYDPFPDSTLDSLKNRVYPTPLVDGQTIELRNERYLNYKFDEGTAYVEGFRFDTSNDTYLEKKKAREWTSLTKEPENPKTPNETLGKQYFKANQDDVFFLNNGLDFQKLPVVDLHITRKDKVHFPTSGIDNDSQVCNTSANTVSANTVIFRSNDGDFNNKNFENWDYIEIYQSQSDALNSINMIQEVSISDIGVSPDLFLNASVYNGVDHFKTDVNTYYYLKKVSTKTKQLKLYNSTNFGQCRLHTTAMNGEQTELHF